jgi:hypothetical protein
MSTGTPAILQNEGTLNPRPDAVPAGLLHTSAFFDARALVQGRYDMRQRVAGAGGPVFLRQGLWAWGQACQPLASPAIPPRRAPYGLSPSLQPALGQGLASLGL